MVAEHRLAEAVNWFRTAVRATPDNAELRHALADVYVSLGMGPSALKEVEKAQEIGLDPAKIRKTHALALILSTRPKDAIELVESWPGFDQSADHLALIGLARLRQNRPEAAAKPLEAALGIDGANPLALLGAAAVDISRGDNETALEHADAAISADPALYDAHLLRGRLLTVAGQYEQAIDAFNRARELNPSSSKPIAETAQTLMLADDYAKARDVLRKPINIAPNDLELLFLDGVAAFLAESTGVAEDRLRAVLAKAPRHGPTNYYLGILMYRRGALEQSQAYLEVFLNSNPNHLPTRKLLATIALRRGNPAAALEFVGVGALDSNDADLIALKAGAMLETGQLEPGLEALETAASLEPENQRLRSGLIVTQLRSGHGDQALKLLESSLEKIPDNNVDQLLLLYAYLHRKQWPEAIEMAKPMLGGENDTVANNALGIAYRAQGDTKAARKHFMNAASKAREPAMFLRNAVLLDLESGDYAAAEPLITRLLNEEPDTPLNLSLAGQVAHRQGNLDAAAEFYGRAVDHGARGPEVLGFLSAYSLKRRNYRQAARYADFGLVNAQRNEQLVVTLTLALLGLKDFDKAAAAADVATTLFPQNFDAHLAAARARLGRGELELAADHLEKAAQLEPDSVDLLSAQLELALARKRMDQARKLLALLYKAEGDSARVRLARAELALADGDTAKAVELWSEIVETTGTLSVAVRLRDLLVESGRGDESIAILKQLVKKDPRNPKPLLTMAYTLERLDRDAEAVQSYERVLTLDESSLPALHNLAQLTLSSNVQKAVEYARRAHEIAPDHPSVNAGLGWALFRAGRDEEGLKYLRAAVSSPPVTGEVRYRYGVALARSGERKEAREQLAMALDDQELESHDDASRLLDSLGGNPR